jgi:hypothetical protein
MTPHFRVRLGSSVLAPSSAAAAAYALQYEYLAWRQARGLTPDVEKVAAVDRAVGDRFEGGDYVFPLLHRSAGACREE